MPEQQAEDEKDSRCRRGEQSSFSRSHCTILVVRPQLVDDTTMAFRLPRCGSLRREPEFLEQRAQLILFSLR